MGCCMDSGKKSFPASAEERAESYTLTVPEMVQRQAAAAPGALAVSCGAQRITYRELSERSNQLAHYLQMLGARAGTLVGLCVERSADFPVAALAILKTGSAYLPLDTKTPSERVRQMLAAAHVPLLITNSGLADSLSGDARKVVALDKCAAELSQSSTAPIEVAIRPGQIAYVIYTSGSTGAPKAVQITHGSLLNLVLWHCDAFGISPQDRSTQLASIGFDAAVWEVWSHLSAGASLHVVDDETRAQPDKLRDFLLRENISISFVPTPIAEQMLRITWPEKVPLRFLLTGADTLRQYPPANLPFTLVNNYGPTECAVVATSAAISPRDAGGGLPPIGRPVRNTDLYILDSNRKPLPPGQIGEIYIGGAGLSPGYLNDSGLTAERFVAHPFSSVPGARLYRTGDFGAVLPDGQIAFHGRMDDQVKLRGHRIELNEVASVLLRHPGVQESYVVATSDPGSEKRLLAYIVPRNGSSPAMADLRGFLARQLPDYMLPAAFITLEVLPVGPNGKVDRAALPLAGNEPPLRDENFVSPRTPTEQRVASIVSRLLGVGEVGVHDNFFLLGGNSLLGTQVIAQLRAAFEVEVPLLELFDHPTVAELTEVVEQLMIARLDAMSEEEAQRRLASLGPAATDL